MFVLDVLCAACSITVADVLIALALTNWGGKLAGQERGARAARGAGARADHGPRRDRDPDQRAAGGEGQPAHRRTRDRAVRQPRPGDRQRHPAGQPHRAQARRPGRSRPPTQYQIDWERSALVNGLVPAQFTVAEDNKTYDLSGQAGPLMEILQILKANNIPLNRHGRHPLEPGAASADPGGGAAGGRAAGTAAQPAQPARRRPPRRRSRLDRAHAASASCETLRASGALTDDEYDQPAGPDHLRNLTPSLARAPDRIRTRFSFAVSLSSQDCTGWITARTGGIHHRCRPRPRALACGAAGPRGRRHHRARISARRCPTA